MLRRLKLVENIKNQVSSIRIIEEKLEELSAAKKQIDLEISNLKLEKDSIREEIEKFLEDSGKSFVSLDDGTEVSLRNSAKNFSWEDDNLVIEFLKSIGKFDSVCSAEVSINKKKAKQIFDKLNDCDGLPPFVNCEQEKVLQIRRPQSSCGNAGTDENNFGMGTCKSDIGSIDSSQFDGL